MGEINVIHRALQRMIEVERALTKCGNFIK